jgi:hypothetical protein
MKITFLPFMFGSIMYGLFTGEWTVTIISGLLLGIMVLTKQVDLY